MSKKTAADGKLIEELQAKVAEYQQGWQRARADYENLQKETTQWKESFGQYAQRTLLQELLPVINHYELALQHIPVEQKEADWIKGIYHIHKQLQDFMTKMGMTKIDTVGQPFDHQWHEAVGEDQDENQPDGIILKEMQVGWRQGDNVLQPAKVIVNNLEKK
ncbi:MAG: nucleotide exchange factor GrpE [Candidatus Komeilibacteria bacterium]